MLMTLPKIDVKIRPATPEDLPFIDALQKKHSRMVGFMQRAALEGKIAANQILVAERMDSPVGYLIGQDQYFKRDDVGIVYQINVVPGKQRGFIGAALLQAQFERSAYGCRLYCCWCAQDIEANKFWESMGFVALAFRTGSREMGRDPSTGSRAPRMHVFWQKRIRYGDTTTPWWFPSQTTGGSIREDRLVLPIPPGAHWSDVKPVVLPKDTQRVEPLTLPSLARGEGKTPVPRKKARKLPPTKPCMAAVEDDNLISNNGLRMAKHDPAHVAAARELRDRWLEKVNDGGLLFENRGKYDITRVRVERQFEVVTEPKRLAA